MKKTNVEINKNEFVDMKENKISRKEAIKKTGYIAISAATMMILVGTPKTASASPITPAPLPKGNNSNQGGGIWKKKN